MKRKSIKKQIVFHSFTFIILILIMLLISIGEFNKSAEFSEKIFPISKLGENITELKNYFESLEHNLEEHSLMGGEINNESIRKNLENISISIKKINDNKLSPGIITDIENRFLQLRKSILIWIGNDYKNMKSRQKNELIISIYSDLAFINEIQRNLSAMNNENLQYLIEIQKDRIHIAILQFIVYGVVILILYIILSLNISRKISDPIIALQKTAAEISKGNLNARADIDSPEEIGELARTFNIMTTKLNKSINNLKKSEEKFRILTDKVPGIIYQINFKPDNSFTFQYLSPQSVSRFGLPENLDEFKLDHFIHPEDKNAFMSSILQAVQKKEEWDFEGRLIPPDGTIKWFRSIASPIEKDDEVLFNGIFLDITEKKKTEKSLAYESNVNAALAELSQKLISSPDDINTIAQFVLRKAMELTGSAQGYISAIDHETKENTGFSETIDHIYHTTDNPESVKFRGKLSPEFSPTTGISYQAIWEEALTSQKPFFINSPPTDHGTEHIENGEIRLHQFIFVPVTFSGEMIGRIVLANPGREYTENDINVIKGLAELYALALIRLKNEQEKTRLEARLRQSQKMEAIGTLAGGIAHDFNNILGAIFINAEIIREEVKVESTEKKCIDIILKASMRARDLIKQILTFSRQADTESIYFKPYSIINEALKMLRHSIPSTIAIKQDINAWDSVIHADPSQIHQVLINLCTNAYQAMEEKGGTLRVSLTNVELKAEDLLLEKEIKPGTFVKLTVRDTGPGIPREIRGKIFDPFFTTKQAGKGTGMGLALVHGIVKQYGGLIKFESEPDRETTFHIFLPVVKKEISREETATQQVSGGKERILFVDDEDIIADAGKQMLEILGYTVTASISAIKALDLFRKNPDQFDLIITDQTMPGMTGSDIAREMLKIRPDIPIIICTGFSSIMTKEKAHSLGIREYIQKPVSMKDMAHLIRKALHSS